MKTIGVFTALPIEGRCLTSGKIVPDNNVAVNRHLLLRAGGMGRNNAETAARALVDAKVDLLVSWGVAAALSETGRAGDLVLTDTVIDSVGGRYTVRPEILQTLEIFARRAGISSISGALVESKRVLDCSEDKIRLHRESGALATDMETAAVAGVADNAHIPHLAIRVISDELHTSVPRAVTRNMNADGHLKMVRMLFDLCRQPRDLTALVRLAQSFKKARRTLIRCAGYLKSGPG